jgi:hypothetical protein
MLFCLNDQEEEKAPDQAHSEMDANGEDRNNGMIKIQVEAG